MFELLEKDALVNLVYSELRRRIPGFKVVQKEASGLMRLLGAVLFFNRRFMTDYVTTFGRTVYCPKDKESTQNSAIATLMHEATHTLDWKLSILLYLTPQVFTVFSLLALLLSPWWLLCLLFILPIPSIGRTYIEARGYGMTIAAKRALGETPSLAAYLPQFTGSAYYWMMPIRCVALCLLKRFAKNPPCFVSILTALEERTHG